MTRREKHDPGSKPQIRVPTHLSSYRRLHLRPQTHLTSQVPPPDTCASGRVKSGRSPKMSMLRTKKKKYRRQTKILYHVEKLLRQSTLIRSRPLRRSVVELTLVKNKVAVSIVAIVGISRLVPEGRVTVCRPLVMSGTSLVWPSIVSSHPLLPAYEVPLPLRVNTVFAHQRTITVRKHGGLITYFQINREDHGVLYLVK
jgi:hypothetical protein